MVYKQKNSNNWWFKFTWRGEVIRESTRQTNKRVAEQIEAARRTALAKGEVGIQDRKPVPTLRQFAEGDFLPFVRSTFKEKPNTRSYYECGVKSLLAFDRLAGAKLDAIKGEVISGYVAKRQEDGLRVSSINRELQALRRMFFLAEEWEKTPKALPKVRMLPGEAHRERVLTAAEESAYLEAALMIGRSIEAAYEAALTGIRAKQRGQTPIKPTDPYLLRDVTTVLFDCALRPEECFRLKWANVQPEHVEILFGKSERARRQVPTSPRVAAILDMRRSSAASEWVFPAETKSGHMEPSTIKKQHAKACKASEVHPFELYILRHTCITRWAPHMDPWTLARIAGHLDMAITKRYVHPEASTIRAAMDRARVATETEAARDAMVTKVHGGASESGSVN